MFQFTASPPSVSASLMDCFCIAQSTVGGASICLSCLQSTSKVNVQLALAQQLAMVVALLPN